jgi:chaperone required for assembly of F1-ATPase
MSDWAPRRFWKSAQVVTEAGGYTIRLDGRPVKTPAKARFVLPTEALAQEIAAEWDAQGDMIRPATMPLTRAANSAIDKVAPNVPDVVAEIVGYGASDLLCYRADGPQALTARQAEVWDPLLGWAAEALGAPLRVTRGVVPVSQPHPSLARLADHVRERPPFELTALHDLVALSGSLIIGLRALNPEAGLDALWRASRIDEDWQIENWGEDDEAAAAMVARRRAFVDAARFFELSAATSR